MLLLKHNHNQFFVFISNAICENNKQPQNKNFATKKEEITKCISSIL